MSRLFLGKNAIVWLIIIFIAYSNYLSFVYIVFVEGALFETYNFQTYDGKHQFTTMPSKGRDVEGMERRFSAFCVENSEYKGSKLFRTFKRNPLKYWRWYEYVSHPRYKYTYKEPSKNSIDHFRISVRELNETFKTDSLYSLSPQ